MLNRIRQETPLVSCLICYMFLYSSLFITLAPTLSRAGAFKSSRKLRIQKEPPTLPCKRLKSDLLYVL